MRNADLGHYNIFGHPRDVNEGIRLQRYDALWNGKIIADDLGERFASIFKIRGSQRVYEILILQATLPTFEHKITKLMRMKQISHDWRHDPAGWKSALLLNPSLR